MLKLSLLAAAVYSRQSRRKRNIKIPPPEQEVLELLPSDNVSITDKIAMLQDGSSGGRYCQKVYNRWESDSDWEECKPCKKPCWHCSESDEPKSIWSESSEDEWSKKKSKWLETCSESDEEPECKPIYKERKPKRPKKEKDCCPENQECLDCIEDTIEYLDAALQPPILEILDPCGCNQLPGKQGDFSCKCK